MFFNSRRHHKYNFTNGYFRKVSIVGKVLVSIILIAIFTRILEIIVNNAIPIIFFIVLGVAIYFSYKPANSPIKRYVNYKQYNNVNISRLQLISILKSLSPRQFEVFCAKLFEALGNKAILTSATNDGGKDVIVNNRIYVECKRYNIDVVGREICQKLLGAVEADGMEKGIVFTNGRVHQNAIEIVKKTKRLEIWDMDRIYNEFNAIENYKASIVLDDALQYVEEGECGASPQTE